MEDEGAPRGIAEALQGILGTLGKEKWDRLNRISKDTGIYTSFVPEQYGGGGVGALGHVVLDDEAQKSIVQLPTSPVPMMMIGSICVNPCLRLPSKALFGVNLGVNP